VIAVRFFVSGWHLREGNLDSAGSSGGSDVLTHDQVRALADAAGPNRMVVLLLGLFDGDLDGVAAAMDAAWINAVQTSAQTTAQDHADSLRTNGQLIKLESTKQMAAGQANQGL
jgi:hypothetical protein